MHPLYSRYENSTEGKSESIVAKISVHAVDRRDSALFTCIASNAYGQDDTNIQLIVQGTVATSYFFSLFQNLFFNLGNG